MPLQYAGGILQEHLATRKKAGLFDVSHMGRFVLRGSDVPAFLQHVLTNNAATLDVCQSQYTIIPNASGGAIDDAYLYRFFEDEYLLVVNAANRQKVWKYFQSQLKNFSRVEITDRTNSLAMLSLQGPKAKDIISSIIQSGNLPEPSRNSLSIASINGAKVLIARTGYTGEPICFELFMNCENALAIWDLLVDRDAQPVGLAARDTLRMEAALPLYGHELGIDPEGRQIPVFACGLSRFAVKFSPEKGEFVGRDSLRKQFEARQKFSKGDFSLIDDLPRLIMPVALVGKGIARAGDKVFSGDKHVGYVTSGTMVPYWIWQNVAPDGHPGDEKGMRPIGLALLDSNLKVKDKVEINIRGKNTEALIVSRHLTGQAPRFARPILYNQLHHNKRNSTKTA